MFANPFHPSPQTVQAILFDAVGTLFRSRGSIGTIYSEVALSHGVVAAPEELDRAFLILTREHGIPTSKTDWRELVRRVFRGAPPFRNFDDFFDDVYSVFRSAGGWQLFAETDSVLRRLEHRGIRLGVVTNFDNRVFGVLEGLAIRRYFGTIQTPETAGWPKPDPRIFIRAATELQATPLTTLVVGDDPILDMGGARQAGMRGLLIDRDSSGSPDADNIHDLNAIFFYLVPPEDSGSPGRPHTG